MSENAATVVRMVEHNTDEQNRETIDRDLIGVIARHHGRFDGTENSTLKIKYR